MRFIKLDASIKPDDLTALAYRVKAATPESTLTAARTALLLANPALKGKKTIPRGTVVLVPDVGGKVPPASDTEPVAMPLSDRGLFTDKEIKKLAEQAVAAVAAAKERAAETAKHLKSAQLRKLVAEQAPELEKALARRVDESKRDSESVTAHATRLDKVFEKMAADAKRLRERMS